MKLKTTFVSSNNTVTKNKKNKEKCTLQQMFKSQTRREFTLSSCICTSNWESLHKSLYLEALFGICCSSVRNALFILHSNKYCPSEEWHGLHGYNYTHCWGCCIWTADIYIYFSQSQQEQSISVRIKCIGSCLEK